MCFVLLNRECYGMRSHNMTSFISETQAISGTAVNFNCHYGT